MFCNLREVDKRSNPFAVSYEQGLRLLLLLLVLAAFSVALSAIILKNLGLSLNL